MAIKHKAIEKLLQRDKERLKRLYKFISQGVEIIDPLTTYIAEGVKIGKGTIIYPLTVIESEVTIGKNCEIGPFARIRKGTKIKDSVGVGNFVEVVRSTIAKGSKAKHLTYLGDTLVEENVNIGAGTIIANYDGKNKNKTVIKKGAFIGSGSILVAPVKIGRNAITGAGAVVTKNRDVPDDTVVIGVPAKIMISKGTVPATNGSPERSRGKTGGRSPRLHHITAQYVTSTQFPKNGKIGKQGIGIH